MAYFSENLIVIHPDARDVKAILSLLDKSKPANLRVMTYSQWLTCEPGSLPEHDLLCIREEGAGWIYCQSDHQKQALRVRISMNGSEQR